jgi:hypothetical protein
MIKDWTEQGLLGAPAFSKSSQRGSDARLYSPLQRQLFSEMLKLRERSPLARVPHHTLCQLVLFLWLNDDTVIPDTQARRAWRTWAQGAGKNSASRRTKTARAVVAQFAHADAPVQKRRAAQLMLEQAEATQDPDWGKIYSILTQICSPWPAQHGERVERGIGVPESPLGVQEAIGLWISRQAVTQRLANEQVPEAVLVQARAEYRSGQAQYEAARPQLQAAATNPEMFAKPSDGEAQMKQQLANFATTLGYVLGLTKEAFAHSATLGPSHQ